MAAQVKEELKATVKVTNTTRYRNSKISVEDNRSSAKKIGYVWISVIVTIFGTIILLDLPIVIQHFRLMLRNIFHTMNGNQFKSSGKSTNILRDQWVSCPLSKIRLAQKLSK